MYFDSILLSALRIESVETLSVERLLFTACALCRSNRVRNFAEETNCFVKKIFVRFQDMNLFGNLSKEKLRCFSFSKCCLRLHGRIAKNVTGDHYLRSSNGLVAMNWSVVCLFNSLFRTYTVGYANIFHIIVLRRLAGKIQFVTIFL